MRAPCRAGGFGRAGRRGGDRLAQQRVAGEVQHVAGEPGVVELVGPKLGRGAAIGGHRAVARGGERDDDASAALARPDDLGSVPGEFAGRQLAGRVRATLADHTGVGAERLRPGRDVRRLAARAGVRDRDAVVSDHERAVEVHDHVEEQVAESGQPHRKIVAWTTTVAPAGSARSRSAASSAPPVRSRRAAAWPQARRSDRQPRGLAAFEDAPCFLELVGDEAQRHREAVEPATGASTRE